MKTFQLEGKTREIAVRPADQKRALKALRQSNAIPAVLYGGEKTIHFSVTNDAVRNLIYTPEIYVIDLTIDGQTVKAIVKDLQFQPVVLEGHAEGVKAGGKLSLQMRKLKVKAIYSQIPEKLTINVDHLGLGKTIQVGALHFEGLEVINAKNAVVCAVQLTRAARGAQANAGK